MATARVSWTPLVASALLVALIVAVGLVCTATPLLSAAAPAAAAGLQTDVVIPAAADATIDSANPAVNDGADGRLYVSYLAGRPYQTRRALLKFVLSSVPSSAVIDSARLELFLLDVGSASRTISAHLVTSDWGEDTVTWSSEPTTGATHADALVGVSTGWYSWDVLALAQSWQSGRNFGLELRGPEGVGLWTYGFASRNYGEGAPRLRITYHLPPATSTRTPTAAYTPTRTNTTLPTATRTNTVPPTTTKTATRTSTAVSTATKTATPTATATHSGGTAWTPTMDAWIDQNVSASASNHGSDIVLRIGRLTGTPLSPDLGDAGLEAYANRWALLRFSPSLPANAYVISATLRLYAEAEAGSGADPFVISPWPLTENWQEMAVTWANQPDFGFSPLLPVNVPATSGYVFVPMTGIVREWAVNPAANYGVMLRGDGVAIGSRRFSSREGANPPLLQVSYVVDNDNPKSPTSVWGSRAEEVWSSNPAITMSWSGATDAASGIHGYSYAWTDTLYGGPDAVEDTTAAWVNTTIPGDGQNWRFLVRAMDNAGNWAATSGVSGFFWLDAHPPTNPTAFSGIPSKAAWTNDHSVYTFWSGAADAAGGSGVFGYSFLWSTQPDTVPDEVANIVGTAHDMSTLTDGVHYAHLRTVDVTGNWSDTLHAGPWKIDTHAPHSHALAGDGSTQTLVNVFSFPVTWTGTDTGSGIHHFDVQFRDETVKSAWQSWQLNTSALSATFYGEGGHIYCFQARAVDNAGNTEAYGDSPDGCVGLAFDDIHVLQPYSIEVTQAVQDLYNGIPLVRGKRTFVRCHVKSDLYGWADVEGQLALYHQGLYLTALAPLNPGGKISVYPDPDRGSLWDSYYFEVPSQYVWADELTFRCLVDVGEKYADFDRSNNSSETTVHFHDRYGIRYTVYQILIEGSGEPWQTLYDAAEMVRNMYPIPVLETQFRWYSNSGYEWDDLPDAGDVLGDLSDKHDENIDEGDDLPNTIYFGMIQTWDDDAGGLGYKPGRTAVGLSDDITHAPHELGHNMYQWHVAGCGNPEEVNPKYPFPGGRISPMVDPSDPAAVYGFDPNPAGSPFPGIYGPDTRDIMSYCVGNRWMSPYTWQWLSSLLTPGAPQYQPAAAAVSASGEYVRVKADVITATNVITLGVFYRVTNTTTNPMPCTAGDYTIRLLGAGGTTLAEHSCAAMIDENGKNGRLSAMIPWVTGTQQIAILRGHGAGATLLATRSVSANAPTVTLLTPNGGETLSGESVAVRWVAADADGDALTYTLDYSHDAGATWDTLKTNIVGTQITLPLSTLPGGDQCLLRVSADDGVNRSRDASDAVFSVADKQPLLHISGPPAGRRVSYGQLVSLVGFAYDIEDGDLSAGVRWTSSISGVLGSGMVQVSDLVTGTHTITLAATDSDGQTVTATTTILVGYDKTINLPLIVK